MKQPEIFRKLNRDNIEAYTPKYAVDIILEFIPKNKIIWAPFSKDSHNFASYLRQKGYKVVNSHYDPKTNTGDDFFKYEPKHWDIMIDNPPFKGKAKYMERAMSFNKPFALFLPVNSIGDNGIPNLFLNQNKDMEMLIPKQRTEFHNQKNNGISFKTVYICWNFLPKQIIFKSMKKVKLITGEE